MLSTLKRLRLAVLRWVSAQLAPRLDMALMQPAPTPAGRLLAALSGLFVNKPLAESIVMGPLTFEIVRTALNIGLFDRLHEKPGLTLPELSQALAVAIYPLEVILPALASLGMVHKIGDRYYDDPFLSLPLLAGANNDLLRKHFEYMHHVIAPAGRFIQETVVENRPAGLHQLYGPVKDYYQRISLDETRRKYFYDFIGTYTQVNRDRVAALPIFSRYQRILDAGGNTGEMSLGIARHHPNARVTVFDFPDTVAQASERIAASGLGDRLDVLAGNFHQDGLPAGYDCILFSHFMEMLSPADYQACLQRAFDRLPARGAVCVFTPVLADDETGPLTNAVISSYFMFLANGEGRIYSAKAISTWMEAVGFTSIERHLLPMHEMVLVGTRPARAG